MNRNERIAIKYRQELNKELPGSHPTHAQTFFSSEVRERIFTASAAIGPVFIARSSNDRYWRVFLRDGRAIRAQGATIKNAIRSLRAKVSRVAADDLSAIDEAMP